MAMPHRRNGSLCCCCPLCWIHHSNGGGVVVSVANETVEFASVEYGSVHWGGCVRGRGGGDIGSVVGSRHDVHAQG